jgi:hypothetical protein
VTDSRAELLVPALVSRSLRYLEVFSRTSPKLNGVELSYLIQPVPLGLWNSSRAVGYVPATPTTVKTFRPPLDWMLRNAAKLPDTAGLKAMLMVAWLVPPMYVGILEKVKAPQVTVPLITGTAVNGPVSLEVEHSRAVMVRFALP